MRQIRAFVVIARLRSFTRASEELHITQAGLSSMLRDTEVQLGCRLFDRTTRTVSLTAEGAAFLPVATRALHDLDEGAAALGRISAATSSSLTVGATPLIASSLMPAVCAAFAVEHPGVTVQVHDLYRSAIQEGVQAATLDAGYGVFLEAASGLRRTPLSASGLTLVYPRAAPPARLGRRGVSWAAIEPLALIGLPAENPIQKVVEKHLASIGRANENRRNFQYLHTLLAMVEANAGCTLLPGFVSMAARRYEVGLAPVMSPRVDFDFFEITHSGRPRSAVVEAFGLQLKTLMTRMQAAAATRT